MNLGSGVINNLKTNKEDFENNADKIFATINNKALEKIIRPMIEYDVKKRIDLEGALIIALRELNIKKYRNRNDNFRSK